MASRVVAHPYVFPRTFREALEINDWVYLKNILNLGALLYLGYFILSELFGTCVDVGDVNDIVQNPAYRSKGMGPMIILMVVVLIVGIVWMVARSNEDRDIETVGIWHYNVFMVVAASLSWSIAWGIVFFNDRLETPAGYLRLVDDGPRAPALYRQGMYLQYDPRVISSVLIKQELGVTPTVTRADDRVEKYVAIPLTITLNEKGVEAFLWENRYKLGWGQEPLVRDAAQSAFFSQETGRFLEPYARKLQEEFEAGVVLNKDQMVYKLANMLNAAAERPQWLKHVRVYSVNPNGFKF